MDIIVNNTKIDFQLEKEKDLLDIIEGLEEWGRKEKLNLSSLRVVDTEGKAYSRKTGMNDFPLDRVKEVHCSLLTNSGLVLESLQVLYHEFENLKSLDQTRLDKEFTQIVDQVSRCKEMIARSIELTEISRLEIVLKEIRDLEVKIFTSREGKFQAKDNVTRLDHLQKLLESLTLRLNLDGWMELIFGLAPPTSRKQNALQLETDIQEQLRGILGEYLNFFDLIEDWLMETAVLLQQGRDASDHLIDLIDSFTLFISLIDRLTSVKTEKLVKESKEIIHLRDLLSKVEQLLKTSEFTDLADLLEYELRPHLDALRKFLKSLLREI